MIPTTMHSLTSVVRYVRDVTSDMLAQSEAMRAADAIADMAHDAGLRYGQSWASLLESLTIEDIIRMADAEVE